MTSKRLRVGSLSLGIILICGAVLSCSAGQNSQTKQRPKQAPVRTVGEQGPSSLAIPGLGEALSPSWVKQGLRLTYKVQTASIAGMGADWREDEDGIWKTEDGRRWTPKEKGSNAAEGYLQLDVTSLSDGAAVISANFYLISKPGEAPKQMFGYPIIGLAANAGGFWVNPAELKKAKNLNTKSLKVQRMPYKIGNTERSAVWIQAIGEQGNMMYVYDEATGVLLHDAVAAEGKASPVIGRNEVSNTPSTTLSSGVLVSQRVINYPWLGVGDHAWSNQPRSMTYEGTTLVPTSGGRPLELGQLLKATPQGNGPGWIRYTLLLTTTNTMGMPPTTTPSETISGLGQFGGVYIPPAALEKLTRGQQLDSDPITLTVVTVAKVMEDQVVITAISPAQTVRWGYDKATGWMNLLEKEDHNILAPIKTHLSLTN